jgi:polar amino acid transport system substrate-binding protein
MKTMRMTGRLCVAATVMAALLFGAPAYAEVGVDQALRAKLPKEILEAGELVSVNSGSFPPYEIVGDNRGITGASADLTEALGALLGLRIRHETVSGLASILAGIRSGRYQLASGPIGDFPERETANDFIDFVQEFVVFAVQKGNPKSIRMLGDVCGSRIAVMSVGSAERVIRQQAEECLMAGRPAVEVMSFPDQPTAILAVRSRRTEAFFSSQAPLTYFVEQAKGQLELAATGERNGFENLYQGSVVPKGSVLGGVVLEGYRRLFDDGTYAVIMKRWGLEGNMIKAPGLNLAGQKAP